MRTYLLVSSKIEYPIQQEPINRIVLHVSSSLIIFDFRTLVNKYVSNELRQLALWSSLLLLYTQTWREVRQNWSLICEIFLNWGTNFVSLKSYEELCTKVAKIENDPEITHLMDLIYNSTNTINNTEQQDEEEDNNNNNDNDDEITEDVVDLSDFQNDHFYTKNVRLNCLTIVHISNLTRKSPLVINADCAMFLLISRAHEYGYMTLLQYCFKMNAMVPLRSTKKTDFRIST